MFDLDEALEIVLQAVSRTLHVTKAIASVFEPGDNGSLTQKKVRHLGYHATSKFLLNDSDGVIDYFKRHPVVLEVTNRGTRANVNQASKGEGLPRAVLDRLNSLGTVVAVPISQGSHLAGLVLLGQKRSGDRFSRRDLAFLGLVSGPTLSAIQKAKLYEGDQTKTEFVSIAAHELLTPITGIQGYISMILDEGFGKVDPQAEGYLSKAYTSTKRLSELVKDLLSVSRIEAGRMEFKPRQIDLQALIRDAVDQVAPNATAKGLALTFEPTADLPPVYADPNRLMEVLINLIGNGIKYTPNGSVTVAAKPDGAFVRVAIQDTGLGITPDAQKHLFEKFYRVRTAETESIAGTGLGLYVTKSMIEKMGGAISVSSTPGQGSVFSFTLSAMPI